MWECINGISNENTPVILFGSGIFSAKVILSNTRQYRYTLIWDKQRKTGFLNANKMPLRRHEDILVFYDKLPTYNPQMVKCLPHQKNHSRGYGEQATNRCYGDFKNLNSEITDYKFPASIIEIPKGNTFTLHPTQKPVALLEYLIRTYTNEGETVLDFTAGSGTTGVAAMNTNRKAVLIEREQKYIDITIQRLRAKEDDLAQRLF